MDVNDIDVIEYGQFDSADFNRTIDINRTYQQDDEYDDQSEDVDEKQ